jgi:hypothetical protein
MGRYSIVPENYDDDDDSDYYDDNDYGEYHDDDDDDLEMQQQQKQKQQQQGLSSSATTRTSPPSIVSITVSRKEKPDGTIVRIKETFLADGTTRTEETIVPRRNFVSTTTAPVAVTRTKNNNALCKNSPKTKSCKSNDQHRVEYIPGNMMIGDRPGSIMIFNKNTRLPQSTDPRSRMMYYMLCRCTITLFVLSVVLAVGAWFLFQDKTLQIIQNLLTF